MRPSRPSDSDRKCGAAARCTTEALERRVMLSNVIPVGPEFRVNTYTTHHQERPDIAMDADGNFVVAWHSFGQDGSATGIYAQRYNTAGVPRGAEFRVNTYTTGYQSAPSLAVASGGEFVIAWSRETQGGSGPDIYAQRYDSTGAANGMEFRVNSLTIGDQTAPTIALDANSDFVVAWKSESGSGVGIFARRYNSEGVALGAEFRVSTYITDRQNAPAVAIDTVGNFVVAWESDGQDGSGDGIYSRRYDKFGMALGGEFQVNTYTTSNQVSPSVAMDDDGDFVVSWESNSQDGSAFGIYTQRFDAAGFPDGSEFRVNSPTTGEQRRPQVSMDANGDFVVAWQSDFGDVSGYDIYAHRYTAAGVPQGEEFPVNTYTTINQQRPTVAVDTDGDFVIVWQSSVQDGNGDGIFAQRYAVVPEVISSSFLFESSPHRLRFRFNHDVRDSLGTSDLLVQNLITGQIIPSNQFVLLYDPASEVATFIYAGAGDAIAGVLPDGRYRATLLANGIITPQGASPAADHQFEFFFLNGDANRDGQVNLRDFDVLAANFGQSGTDFTLGDFTYDGTTDLEDFDILAAKFGMTLPSAIASLGDEQLDEDDRLSELLL